MGILLPIMMAVSIVVTFFSLSFAILKRSWQAMLVSVFASLPVSLYLAGVNPPLSFLGGIPMLLLFGTFIMKRRDHKQIAR
ncbi:hypothetical protein NCCP2716_27040 [Sporosarcina sp. NCCP-2716]|uniref:hypothetical protein n=1 Tax=Sporosarcina sp. NCCP-2716 TaxID=2943679 RepID=UPI00203FE73E|nr:hypothetical protein [Sporosarcina sp. NCCP-2716]GKV70206.1 hypothetical protein NCCP2716_27040 [Sporosarcina sp. NCCP-2716]